jgi:hypothetical protein
MEGQGTMTLRECAEILRRTGFPEERITEIQAALPDPIDFERDATVLLHYGLTRDRLMDLMGGSP